MDEINSSGGIAGREVQIAKADAADSATTALNAFNQVVNQGAVVVMGPVFGAQAEALLDPAEKAEVPLFTSSGTAGVTQRGSDWVYRWIPNDELSKTSWISFAQTVLDARKVGLIAVQASYGQSAAKYTTEAATAAGISVAGPEFYNVTDKDMTVPLSRLRDQSPDALLIQGYAPDQQLILQQTADLGLETPIVMSMSNLASGAFEILSAPIIAGNYSEGIPLPQFSTEPDGKRFAEEYAAEYGAQPDHMSFGQYNAMMLVKNALEKDNQASGVELNDAIKGSSQSLYGLELSPNSTGDLIHKIVYYQFDEAKNATVVYTAEASTN